MKRKSLRYRADTGSGVNHQVTGLFDCHSELPDFIFQLINTIKYLKKRAVLKTIRASKITRNRLFAWRVGQGVTVMMVCI